VLGDPILDRPALVGGDETFGFFDDRRETRFRIRLNRCRIGRRIPAAAAAIVALPFARCNPAKSDVRGIAAEQRVQPRSRD